MGAVPAMYRAPTRLRERWWVSVGALVASTVTITIAAVVAAVLLVGGTGAVGRLWTDVAAWPQRLTVNAVVTHGTTADLTAPAQVPAGGTASIAAAGFAPSASVIIGLCTAAEVDRGVCVPRVDNGRLGPLTTADAAGRIHADLIAPASLGGVSCAIAGNCLVVAATPLTSVFLTADATAVVGSAPIVVTP